jgi:hypothetical protein
VCHVRVSALAEEIMRVIGLGLVFSVLACAAIADEAGKYDKNSAHDRIGRIYNYVRSNRDGSEPEFVSVYRADRTHLEVYKHVRNCTNAALVTAVFDPDLGMAIEIHGGRLQPDARHVEFAKLTWNREKGTLTAAVDGAGAAQEVSVPDLPFHVYDFDLASLTVATPHLKDPRAGFSFGLSLVFNEPTKGWTLKTLGRADARFEAEEVHDGRTALRFHVEGPALAGQGGPLWLDKADGHVLGAEWGLPNHAEYKDFKLTLVSIDDGGANAWAKLLRAHYDGCQ